MQRLTEEQTEQRHGILFARDLKPSFLGDEIAPLASVAGFAAGPPPQLAGNPRGISPSSSPTPLLEFPAHSLLPETGGPPGRLTLSQQIVLLLEGRYIGGNHELHVEL